MKVQSSELRIGNWIKDGNEFEQITIDHLVCANRGRCEYEPIPLTEEWLLKFGFEKLPDLNDYDSYSEYYLHQKSGLRLIFYLGNYDDASINGDIDNIDLSHVHQLQNLYFALTGEELTINRYNEKHENNRNKTGVGGVLP